MTANRPVFRALLRKGWDPVIIADRLALGLARARLLLVLPLAQAAADFIDGSDWRTFGYARIEDHARERFGRSGRWLRDLRSLDEAAAQCPALALALTGKDGGPPLGTVAALLIGRIATPETCAAWIDRARRLTVRELRERIRRERSSAPGDVLDPAGEEAAAWDPDTLTLRFLVPPPIEVAIEEARDLHRAVCGGEATLSEFIEALLAEAFAGPVTPMVNEGWIGARPSQSAREIALERKGEGWSFLRDVHLEGEQMCEARQTLEQAARLCLEMKNRSCPADSRIRALIRLENEIELRIGDLLAMMGDSGAWKGLRFSGVGHYAEERLGMSRSVAHMRCRMSRVFRKRHGLRAACEDGRLSLEAASLVARVMGEGASGGARAMGNGASGGDGPDPWAGFAGSEPDERPIHAAMPLRGFDSSMDEQEAAWIERAQEATIKRLREELRIVDRDRALRTEGCGAAPVDDETWQRSRSRKAGQCMERLDVLTKAACEGPTHGTLIHFRLPLDLASTLRSAVVAERERLERTCRELEPTREAASSQPGSVRAALMFSKRGHGVPEWCALLALLEGFVGTWDDPRQCPRRAADKIYIRDGWRCSAPGCTSRRNLEEHHIVYRGRGGDDSLSNRVTLCRFHHQQGEHAGLLRCRGRAPLGILWAMGRRWAGGMFKNERRVDVMRRRRASAGNPERAWTRAAMQDLRPAVGIARQ